MNSDNYAPIMKTITTADAENAAEEHGIVDSLHIQAFVAGYLSGRADCMEELLEDYKKHNDRLNNRGLSNEKR